MAVMMVTYVTAKGSNDQGKDVTLHISSIQKIIAKQRHTIREFVGIFSIGLDFVFTV